MLILVTVTVNIVMLMLVITTDIDIQMASKSSQSLNKFRVDNINLSINPVNVLTALTDDNTALILMQLNVTNESA